MRDVDEKLHGFFMSLKKIDLKKYDNDNDNLKKESRIYKKEGAVALRETTLDYLNRQPLFKIGKNPAPAGFFSLKK